ncbi:nucleoside triphosphate pyrophosphohydrolase family protein [Chromobacterium haemolyticum]|uniref:Nucleoside triphosphate pyrophosphohydrolase family protein n=1 Tax=Chromobacterium fluminis TaxID=3044269 RepID=A0ABX0L5A7_9NEIS|nr:nucleoside triphosphate pyrophosphohydrolase family protein [Chromobacterium haemolyticum]NHR06997.1 nucleoside triphosphate pyrophosphohydrolase family protein [Chromobacterium haemolyticum]OQS42936.1 phosphoribosyl-ATP pyrophosphohydrolase [Chromobacterium haemolyticum]
MENFFTLRRHFMSQFDIPSPQRPQWQPQQLAMWETMLGEELAEFQQALADYKRQDGDETERARRMAELLAEGVDVLNVLSGLLMSQGLPLEDMTREIHAANMRKCVDGKIVRREDGKVLKPAGWQPADKEGVIRRALES